MAIRKLTDDLGIPSASEVGVRAQDIPAARRRPPSANVSVESNPRVATEKDFRGAVRSGAGGGSGAVAARRSDAFVSWLPFGARGSAEEIGHAAELRQ